MATRTPESCALGDRRPARWIARQEPGGRGRAARRSWHRGGDGELIAPRRQGRHMDHAVAPHVSRSDATARASVRPKVYPRRDGHGWS